MNVTYTLTEADVYAFQLHFYDTRKRAAYLMFRWGFTLICFVIAFLIFGFRPGVQNRLMFGAFCFAGMLLLAIAPLLWRSNLRKHVRRQSKAIPGFGQPVRLTITPDGFTITAPVGETRWKWEGVLEITETAGHLFLWISTVYAVVLPKRALTDDSDIPVRIRECHESALGSAEHAKALN